MFYFNITFNIDEAIQEKWVSLMTSQIMPSMPCDEKKLLQIMVDEEMGGVSYSCFLGFSNATLLERFKTKNLGLIYETINKSFSGQWVSFTTQLNLLSDS